VKPISRLLRDLGKFLYSEEGKIHHKTVTTKIEWTVLELTRSPLGARMNKNTRCIEIFREAECEPSFVIPTSASMEERVVFTHCQVCGQVAFFCWNPEMEEFEIQCIEKPPHHQYVLSKRQIQEEMR